MFPEIFSQRSVAHCHSLLKRGAASVMTVVLSAAVAAPAAAQSEACLRGVNISGAEYGGTAGNVGTDYVYPSEETLSWASQRGMTAIRLPFRWERLQPKLFAALDSGELALLQRTIVAANARGLAVILDPHNYAAYRDNKIGTKSVPTDALADFWRRVSNVLSGNEDVIFGLMNEPAGVTARVWFDAAQASVDAIRAAGADNLILVPGTIWSGASHWFDDQEGGSNADLFDNFSDPGDRFAFEFHQYMDADFSGTGATCPRTEDALSALESVTGWLQQKGFSGFLGEFGGTVSPDCLDGLMKTAGFLNRNADVWIGWSAWAAGPWWGDYPLSLQPVGPVDKPQMRVLRPFLSGAGVPATCGPA